MRVLCVAEKPSIAKSISQILASGGPIRAVSGKELFPNVAAVSEQGNYTPARVQNPIPGQRSHTITCTHFSPSSCIFLPTPPSLPFSIPLSPKPARIPSSLHPKLRLLLPTFCGSFWLSVWRDWCRVYGHERIGASDEQCEFTFWRRLIIIAGLCLVTTESVSILSTSRYEAQDNRRYKLHNLS